MKNIFISYSHKDEPWKDWLQKHLDGVSRYFNIRSWDDRNIIAGSHWPNEITRAIYNSDIAILLMSSNFLSSQFIQGQEIPLILKKHQQDGLVVMPLILEPCLWNYAAWLNNIQVFPKDGKPLLSGNEYEINLELSNFVKQVCAYSDDPNLRNSSPTLNKYYYLEQAIAKFNRGMYEEAVSFCSKSLEKEEETDLAHYFLAFSRLKGRRPKILKLSEIEEVERSLKNAIQCNQDNACFYYLWAFVKYDFFYLNGLKMSPPDYIQLIDVAEQVRANNPFLKQLLIFILNLPNISAQNPVIVSLIKKFNTNG